MTDIEKVARAHSNWRNLVEANPSFNKPMELAFRAGWKAAIAAMQPAPQWQGIETAPSGIPIIGLRDPNQTGRQPAFIGEVYDLRKNALIDVWSGRWAVCTHWMPLPTPHAGGSDEQE